MSGCDFKALADSLSERFLAEGFTVHRYDAYSTSSVYLKLDCGMCNSIRISDHRGKKDHDGRYPRHYYPIDEADVLVANVLRDRERRKKRYGEAKYEALMRDNEIQGAQATCGFWSQARKVER